MNSLKLHSLAAAALWLFLTVVAQAAPRFSGPVRYDFANNQTSIVLQADLIDNSSKENASGTLQLQLWATTYQYEGGTIRGTLLASTKMEGLSPGQFYKGFRKTVPYSAPAVKGSYFMTMALLEYRNGGYVIAHYINMNNKANLGPLPLFTMSGPWKFTYSTEGGTLDMAVAKIAHRRTGHTGSLKLSVWMTAAPYTGGLLKGYEIGKVQKDPLKPGYEYTNVKNTAKFAPPPAGTYWPVLVLSESNGQNYETVAWLNASGTSTF